MSGETLHLSPVEKELRFTRWCEERNIKQFTFDMDDSICWTRRVFRDHESQGLGIIEKTLNLPPKNELRDDFEAINNRLFEEIGVNPNRWNRAVDELSIKYPLSKDDQTKIKDIFAHIYLTPLEIFPEAEILLKFLQKVQMPVGIVTHANKDWTWRKYNWLGLDRFMDWSDIFIVDENGHKTKEAWEAALKYFRVIPGQTVVVGDSPRSDINPARETGVKYCFLLESDDPWSVHNQAVDPSTIIIKDLREITEIGRLHRV